MTAHHGQANEASTPKEAAALVGGRWIKLILRSMWVCILIGKPPWPSGFWVYFPSSRGSFGRSPYVQGEEVAVTAPGAMCVGGPSD